MPDNLKSVNIKSLRYGVDPYYPDADPFNVKFWVEISEWSDSSRKNLEGTGLWKLSLQASEEKVNSVNGEQVLSVEESSKGFVDGEKLRVKSEQTAFTGMGGCPGQNKFICFTLSKGPGDNPDFILEKSVSGCLEFKFTCKGKVDTDIDRFQMFLNAV